MIVEIYSVLSYVYTTQDTENYESSRLSSGIECSAISRVDCGVIVCEVNA